jgi:hypothetical protein
MLASQNGHTEALALLLANGAIVNAAKQVVYNFLTVIHEFDRNTSQNLSVCRTHFVFQTRMGGLPLCSLHLLGTQLLLRF